MIHTKCIYIILVINCLFVVHIKSTLWTPFSNGTLGCILYNDHKSSLDLTWLGPRQFSDSISGVDMITYQICGDFKSNCVGYPSYSCYYDFGQGPTPFGLVNETQEYNFTSTGIELTYSALKQHNSCIKKLKVILVCDRTNPGSIKGLVYRYGSCDLVFIVTTEYVCMTCYNDCSGRGYCNEITGECICTNDQSTGIGCLESRLSISNITNTTVLGGTIIIDGYFGTTSQNIVVLVGDLSCENIIATKTNITCSLPPLKKKNGLLKDVIVLDNGFNATKVNGFTYQNLTCTQSCNINHSYCNGYTGICECDTQSNGDQCQLSKISINSISASKYNDFFTLILYGYFGQITPQFNITIGNILCNNITQYNYTAISCEIGSGYGTHNVTAQDNDLIFIGINLFTYPTINNNNNNKNKIIIVSVVVPVVVVSLVLISISIIYKRYHHNKSKSKNINNIKLGSSLSQISKDKLYL